MIAVSDLIEYRLKHESLIKLEEKSQSVLAGFKAEKFIFSDHNQTQHIAFCFKDIKKCENVTISVVVILSF